MYAKEWAMRFNLYNPPKRVDFIACSVLELIERPGKPICGVERFIEGPYRKHNNNIGFVSEAERNTPQAFSHFTYYASNRSIVICDIQGVGDLYTDPQIHTIANLKGIETVFGGKGNMGVLGLERFLESHRCNPICAYLRLPPVQGSESSSVSRGGGTLPHTPYMEFQKVEVLRVQIKVFLLFFFFSSFFCVTNSFFFSFFLFHFLLLSSFLFQFFSFLVSQLCRMQQKFQQLSMRKNFL